MPKSTKPVNSAIRQKAVAKYFKGGTLDDVADEFNMSRSSLQRFVKAEKARMLAIGVSSNKQIILNQFSKTITKTKTMSATLKKKVINEPIAAFTKEGKTIILTTKSLTKQIVSEVVHTWPIEKTRDYNVFTFDVRNRPINKKVVAEFVKKFQEGHNYMADNPIQIDENFVILDGQHRYEACKLMGIDLYYRHVTDLTIDNVQQVQSSNGWKPSDFLYSYQQQEGKEAYVKLDAFVKRFKLPVSTAIGLLSGSLRSIGGGFGLKGSGFRQGTLEISEQNEAHANLIMMHCEEFEKYGFNYFRERSFILAVAKIKEVKGYKEGHMNEKMRKFGSILKRQMTTKDYIKNLEDVYNYRARETESLRFS